MDLSYMKIGKKEFFLEMGDEFFTNGSCFTYRPVGRINKDKCARYDDSWTPSTTIEITKAYKELILSGKCTNLELIKDTGITGTGNHYRTWRVTSISEVKLEKSPLGQMWYISIGVEPDSFTGNADRAELFTIRYVEIAERTARQIVLKEDLNHIRKWNAEGWLNKLIIKHKWGADRLTHRDSFGVYLELKPDVGLDIMVIIEEWKQKLLDAMKQKLTSELKHAQERYDLLTQLAEKEGYSETV